MIGANSARTASEKVAGKTYYRERGVEHNVVDLSVSEQDASRPATPDAAPHRPIPAKLPGSFKG